MSVRNLWHRLSPWLTQMKIMPDSSPALWSAVAAIFAALTSLLAYLTMRRGLLDSARPEIVLEDWDRYVEGERDALQDTISFQTIRNDGLGTAHGISIRLSKPLDMPSTASFSSVHFPILAPNKEIKINGEIRIAWKNVSSETEGQKSLFIAVEILSRDSKSIRHQTRHSFVVLEPSTVGVIADEFAPGVGHYSRTTVSRPVWFLKLIAKGRRFSGLDRLRRWQKTRASNK